MDPPCPGVRPFFEAAGRYAFAVDLAQESRLAWYALEQPLIVLWPNGIESAHPLIKVIREAKHDAARFALALGIDAKVKGRSGRKPEAAIGPKVGRSRAAKLRETKLKAVR